MLYSIQFENFDFYKENIPLVFSNEIDFNGESKCLNNVLFNEIDISKYILKALNQDLLLCNHLSEDSGVITLTFVDEFIVIYKLTVTQSDIKQTILMTNKSLDNDEVKVVNDCELSNEELSSLNRINKYIENTLKINNSTKIKNLDLKHILNFYNCMLFLDNIFEELTLEEILKLLNKLENNTDNVQRFFNIDMKHWYILNNLNPKICRMDNVFYKDISYIVRYSDYGISISNPYKLYVLDVLKQKNSNE